MATLTKGKTFVSGEVVTPQKLNDLVDLASVAGIVNADIDAAAAIAAAKLASTLDLSTKTVTLPDNVVTTAKIADSSSTTTGVTNSKIRQSAALSVIGNATNATAAPADIAAATDGHVMRRSGTAIGFGTIVNAATTATSANTASAIVARDASGNFTAGTITASLTGNVTGNLTGTASAVAAGMSISYPTLTGVREAIVNLGAVSGSQTFNLQSGNIFQVKPNGSITVAPSNVPASGTFVGILVRHEGDGTARTYTWPGTTKWAYGQAPSMTSTNGKFDLVSLFTYDGGTTYFGQILGQNY